MFRMILGLVVLGIGTVANASEMGRVHLALMDAFERDFKLSQQAPQCQIVKTSIKQDGRFIELEIDCVVNGVYPRLSQAKRLYHCKLSASRWATSENYFAKIESCR